MADISEACQAGSSVSEPSGRDRGSTTSRFSKGSQPLAPIDELRDDRLGVASPAPLDGRRSDCPRPRLLSELSQGLPGCATSSFGSARELLDSPAALARIDEGDHRPRRARLDDRYSMAPMMVMASDTTADTIVSVIGTDGDGDSDSESESESSDIDLEAALDVFCSLKGVCLNVLLLVIVFGLVGGFGVAMYFDWGNSHSAAQASLDEGGLATAWSDVSELLILPEVSKDGRPLPSSQAGAGAQQMSLADLLKSQVEVADQVSQKMKSPRIVFLPDLHGDWDLMIQLLTEARILKSGYTPKLEDWKQYSGTFWNGRNEVLIQGGDVVGHGEHGRAMYEFLWRLQDEAARSQGRVVLLLGDYELNLLAGSLAAASKSEQAWYAQESMCDAWTSPDGAMRKEILARFKNGGMKVVHREASKIFVHAGITSSFVDRAELWTADPSSLEQVADAQVDRWNAEAREMLERELPEKARTCKSVDALRPFTGVLGPDGFLRTMMCRGVMAGPLHLDGPIDLRQAVTETRVCSEIHDVLNALQGHSMITGHCVQSPKYLHQEPVCAAYQENQDSLKSEGASVRCGKRYVLADTGMSKAIAGSDETAKHNQVLTEFRINSRKLHFHYPGRKKTDTARSVTGGSWVLMRSDKVLVRVPRHGQVSITYDKTRETCVVDDAECFPNSGSSESAGSEYCVQRGDKLVLKHDESGDITCSDLFSEHLDGAIQTMQGPMVLYLAPKATPSSSSSAEAKGAGELNFKKFHPPKAAEPARGSMGSEQRKTPNQVLTPLSTELGQGVSFRGSDNRDAAHEVFEDSLDEGEEASPSAPDVAVNELAPSTNFGVLSGTIMSKDVDDVDSMKTSHEIITTLNIKKQPMSADNAQKRVNYFNSEIRLDNQDQTFYFWPAQGTMWSERHPKDIKSVQLDRPCREVNLGDLVMLAQDASYKEHSFYKKAGKWGRIESNWDANSEFVQVAWSDQASGGAAEGQGLLVARKTQITSGLLRRVMDTSMVWPDESDSRTKILNMPSQAPWSSRRQTSKAEDARNNGHSGSWQGRQ